jgi:hypothetical protein
MSSTNPALDPFAFTYRTFICVVTCAFAFPQREIINWVAIVAHQNKHACRRHVAIVLLVESSSTASRNDLSTGSLIAV